MPDSYVQVPADSTGKKIDASSLDVGANTVMRQRIVLADNSATAQFATVTAGSLLVTGNVNLSATASVVIAAGTANIGTVNDISKTVQVAIGTPFTVNNVSATVQVAIGTPFTVNNISAAVVLAAGTANIGSINNISATVSVVNAAGTANIGAVSLGAGTANIGFINNISATVAAVLAAGSANIGSINNISATIAAVLAAGTANIGTLNDISRTVQVAIGTPFTVNNVSATVTVAVSGFTPAIMSVSHGPKCVTASTSATVTLIASPGTGVNLYITQLMVGNASATLTKARIGTSASANTIVQPLAASGGGFVFNFNPPWMLSASEAAICSVKPNVADVFFTVNYFVK